MVAGLAGVSLDEGILFLTERACTFCVVDA